MKPQIRLIDGLHLTATDKRNLLAVIEFERAPPPRGVGDALAWTPQVTKELRGVARPGETGSVFRRHQDP